MYESSFCVALLLVIKIKRKNNEEWLTKEQQLDAKPIICLNMFPIDFRSKAFSEVSDVAIE